MMNALTTYITQRFNAGLWLAVSVLLLLYSVPVSGMSRQMVLVYIFLFCTLFVFRLYDDLQQTIHDSGKPNRDYTNPQVRKILWSILIVLMVVLTGTAFLMGKSVGWIWVCFIVINHLLYLLCMSNKTAAALLPLLKYPFLVFLLQMLLLPGPISNAIYLSQAFALFIAFVAFESMEDQLFPILHSYFLQAVSFLLLLVEDFNVYTMICMLILLSLSLAINYRKWKLAPYLFMLLFLLFKLTIYSFNDISI
jgi:hypothetical protein